MTKELNPILAAYLTSLAARPLLTKSITSAVSGFLSEVIAARVAGSKGSDIVKPLKLSCYGFFVSAPLSHALLSLLQKAFAGKDSPKYKILMIIVANLMISPIQQGVYLASMAVINGASTLAQVKEVVAASYLKVLKLSWLISPISMGIAQRFLEPEMWVPFFTAISAVFGTVINIQAKKAAALRLKGKKTADEK